MPTFTKSTIIRAPIARVFAFHERDDALQLLSPSFPPLRVISRTGGLQPGARVELKIGVITWIAMHTAYEPGRLFIDEQIRGPFRKWIHRHEFENSNGATRLTDKVEFQLPGGPVMDALLGWAVRLALDRMFTHRHEVTRRQCE